MNSMLTDYMHLSFVVLIRVLAATGRQVMCWCMQPVLSDAVETRRSDIKEKCAYVVDTLLIVVKYLCH
jgi:hypothetical protein